MEKSNNEYLEPGQVVSGIQFAVNKLESYYLIVDDEKEIVFYIPYSLNTSYLVTCEILLPDRVLVKLETRNIRSDKTVVDATKYSLIIDDEERLKNAQDFIGLCIRKSRLSKGEKPLAF